MEILRLGIDSLTCFIGRNTLHMKKSALFALLLCALISVGCSENVSITGKVTFSDDNAPAPNGIICFDSGANVARGTIKSDGTFKMGTLKEADGLPAGSYKVFFVDVREETGKAKTSDGSEGEPIYTSLIDSKYLSPDTSELTAVVNKDTKELNFSLDRNPDFPK